jgi:hypothetical protein
MYISNNKSIYKQLGWMKRNFSIGLLSSSENGLVDKTLIKSHHGKNQSE